MTLKKKKNESNWTPSTIQVYNTIQKIDGKVNQTSLKSNVTMLIQRGQQNQHLDWGHSEEFKVKNISLHKEARKLLYCRLSIPLILFKSYCSSAANNGDIYVGFKDCQWMVILKNSKWEVSNLKMMGMLCMLAIYFTFCN